MQPGYIEAIGYDANSNEIARHKIETAGKPVRIKLTPVVGPEGLRADGSDIAFVDVEIVDACGRVHPLDYKQIDFALSGPAEFLGGYNSGVKDLGHDCNYVYAECGVNRVFIRSTRQAGIITLRAFRADLPTTIVTIESKPFSVDESGLTEIMPQVTIPNLDESELRSSSDSMFEIANSAEYKTGVFTSDRTSDRKEIRVFVDERQVDFGKNLSAYRMVGVYGPAFYILDALDLNYKFDEQKQKLTIKCGEITVETAVSDSDMYINGVPGTINDWPEVIDKVLHMEISAVIPALGFKTYWGTDGESYYIVAK
jgi:beta-galactosidase